MITSQPSSLTLIDGASVVIRQLGADDYDAVVALSETLSDRERYMRFFTTHPGYLDQWARTLTVHSDEQCALGIFEDDTLIGTASYVLTAEPGCAEVSVVIAHLQHERGVGPDSFAHSAASQSTTASTIWWPTCSPRTARCGGSSPTVAGPVHSGSTGLS